MEPLVSVYVPTRDRPELLDGALASLARQTHRNLEVLVCDDESSVSLDAIRERYAKAFTRLVWLRNEPALGAPSSRNRMIEAATGEYITGLDDDDEFLPNRISAFLAAPQLHTHAFLCSTYRLQRSGWSARSTPSAAEPITCRQLLKGNVVGNQVFVRTERLRAIGGFDPAMPSWQDHDVWLRLAKAFGDGYRIPDATYVTNLYTPRSRITTGRSGNRGVAYFIEKHGSDLSTTDRKHLFFHDLLNRNAPAPTGDVLRNLAPTTVPLALKWATRRVVLH